MKNQEYGQSRPICIFKMRVLVFGSSFAVLGLLFMGAYLLAYVQMGNVWDLIRELFNPTVLYATSGGWFMENDLCLSFAGNEFAVLFCSGTAAVCLMAVGKRRYHRLEV